MGYLNSLNAGLNDDITHFPQWEYIAVMPISGTDSMDYFPSKTSRTDLAKFTISIGFSMYFRMPSSRAFSAVIF